MSSIGESKGWISLSPTFQGGKKAEARLGSGQEKQVKNQLPLVCRTSEDDAIHIEICAKESNEDEKSVASKSKQQLNIPDEVKCCKRKKLETINKGQHASPDGLISKKRSYQ